MNKECLFCLISRNKKWPIEIEDTVIDESKNFILKPALGEFIEGYALIITKEHLDSISFLPPNLFEELRLFKKHVKHNISLLYGSTVIVFEHGIVNPSNYAGCCIDHAHLHILPFNDSILQTLENKFLYEIIHDISELSQNVLMKQSYIYYESTKDKFYSFKIEKPIVGQFVRRLICRSIGSPDIYDWAIHPFRDKIAHFVNRYVSEAKKFSIIGDH